MHSRCWPWNEVKGQERWKIQKKCGFRHNYLHFPQLKKEQKNYNPAIRSIAPTRIPNMDVDAENIPIMIYPAMTPISNGI